MNVTGVEDNKLGNLVPSIWSPIVYDELRKSLIFGQIFDRKYEGAIKSMGDTVKVHQVIAPEAEEFIDNDKGQFNSQAMVTVPFEVKANRRAIASFEITDTALLQSMEFQTQAQTALVYALKKKVDDVLIAALAAGASLTAPDHNISPVTPSSLASVDLRAIRALLKKQSVATSQCYGVLGVEYYSDLIGATQLTSSDFVGPNQTTESGEIKSKLYGFTFAETENLGDDVGYFCHPSALQVVMQQEVRIQTTPLLANKQLGMLVVADILWGYNIFDNKRYVKITG